MTPKWQKARVVKSRDFAHLIGTEFWALIGEPNCGGFYNKHGDINDSPYNRVNLLWNGECAAAAQGCLEFLARGPEDFAEDVEIVPYEVWTSPDWKGCE